MFAARLQAHPTTSPSSRSRKRTGPEGRGGELAAGGDADLLLGRGCAGLLEETELVERSELNELVLGPIDWDDLRTANDKLTEAIGNQA